MPTLAARLAVLGQRVVAARRREGTPRRAAHQTRHEDSTPAARAVNCFVRWIDRLALLLIVAGFVIAFVTR
jgi:hypothetical protein